MSIPHEVKNRIKVIKYAEHYSIAKAAVNYHTAEKNIYRWRKKLKDGGGDIMALANKSRRPKSHPNSHTAEEIKLIKDMRRRNPNIGLRLQNQRRAHHQLARKMASMSQQNTLEKKNTNRR